MTARRWGLSEPFGPTELLAEPRPCQVCGQPARMAGAKQRSKAEHVCCRGRTYSLTEEAYWRTIYAVLDVLPGTIIEIRED